MDFTERIVNKLTIESLEQENKQLKEQLAEKDEIIIELEARCKTIINEKYELEQQLAEKDKEIEELKTFNAKNIYDTICHALNMQKKTNSQTSL